MSEALSSGKPCRTARDFWAAIVHADQGQRWVHTAVKTRDSMDGPGTAEVFWLTGSDWTVARAGFEHGRLIVTFDGPDLNYWFDLDRLHESWPQWSWQQQLREKSWCKPIHLQLLYELCDLFPPIERARRAA